MHELMFDVEALSVDGKRCRTSRMAQDQALLVAQLHKEGLLLIRCRKKHCFTSACKRFTWQRYNETVRLQFINGLCNTIRTGIPLLEALQIISRTSNQFLRIVCAEVRQNICSGNSLQEAMEKTGLFDTTHLAIISAGEISGTLDVSLQRLRDMFQEKQLYKSKLMAALLYPLFTLLVTMLCIYAISTYILPQIIVITSRAGSIGNSDLVLLSIIGHYVPLFFFFLSVFILINSFLLKNNTDYFKKPAVLLLLKIPIAGNLIMLCESAIFARLLGILLQSGVRIDRAFRLAAASCSFEMFRNRFCLIADNLSRGIEMEQAVASLTSSLPGIMTEAFLIGSRTGSLPETLDFAIDCMECEIATQKSILTSLLQPFFITMIGAFIAYFAYTVFSYVYGMIGSI